MDLLAFLRSSAVQKHAKTVLPDTRGIEPCSWDEWAYRQWATTAPWIPLATDRRGLAASNSFCRLGGGARI